MRDALKQNSECWYTVGDGILLIRDVDLGSFGVIPQGSEGIIAFVDPVSLYTEILMSSYHYGLRDWRNHLWLIPPDTDDIEAAILRR